MSDGLSIEEKITQDLRKYQEFGYAIIGGIASALIGAAIWAVVTVSTNYQIGYMAVGVGLLAGFAVRFFGAGVDVQYRVVGAACALFGCMLGNLFSQVWFIAESESLGYFETLGYLNFEIIRDLFQETFSFMDVLFYGIAIYEGYRFAVREVSDEMIQEYTTTGSVQRPANSNLRLPIAIVCFVSIGVLLYIVGSQGSGAKTFFYDSGEKMSEGELVSGKEDGLWTYWYPSGQVQLTGSYKNGFEHGEWQWFDENGKLSRKASFADGLLEGSSINYYPNGIASDSGNYSQGRKDGLWIYKSEGGKITATGRHVRDQNEGEWVMYHPDGSISSKGSFKKGIQNGRWQFWYPGNKLFAEQEFVGEDDLRFINVWDWNGNQIVTNGNGTFRSFTPDGKLEKSFGVIDGKQTGTWTTFYPNGSKHEEGEFKNTLMHVLNAWNAKGEQTVTSGMGSYTSFHDPKEAIINETGPLSNGLRNGLWIQFYETGADTLQTAEYVNGKPEGSVRLYSQNGLLYAEGNMKNGKRDGEWKWYSENGNLESSVTFIDGKKEGVQYFWGSRGDILKEEVYKDDELISEKVTNQDE